MNLNDVKKLYQKRLFDEKTCARCYNKSARFNEICAACPAHLGIIKLWDELRIKNTEYISLPSGNLKKITDKLKINLSGAIDKRSNVPFKYPLKFTGKLYTGEDV